MICGFFIVRFSKAEIHLFINSFNNNFFDIFFKHITILGDGICLPVFIIFMIWFRFRNGIYLLTVFLLSGFLVQLLKRSIFHDIARPTNFFGENGHIHLVKGVDQLCCNSFPSGHSATAFGFYLCFAIVSKRKWVKGAMLVLACLVAYSRVYLSQHFLVDIVAGSLIGTIIATVCYPWIYSLQGAWLDKDIKIIISKNSK